MAGPQRIANVLAELMAKRGLGRVQGATALASAWSESVGELASRYTRAGLVRRGTLEVTVANSVLVQELTFQKQQILAKLAELLPDHAIRDLKFRVGSI